jgi:uncharacterized protein YndB with AHSA1/START domain
MTTRTLKVTTPSDREVALTRSFDAPRDLVFEAYTKPALLKRWFGPKGWTLVVCEIDLRVGGRWRYEMQKVDGSQMGFGGVYQEIVRPERIVSSEEFDDPWYKGAATSTVTLVEQAGKTTFTLSIVYESKEVRDAVLKSGMETGVAASYERLDKELASLQASSAEQRDSGA